MLQYREFAIDDLRSDFEGPELLRTSDLPLPRGAGSYLVTCGDGLALIGSSSKLRERVTALARLEEHEHADELLCLAHCTRQAPSLWWQSAATANAARARAAELRNTYGEPPAPNRYERCRHGAALRSALLEAAGTSSYEAGFITAVFSVGNRYDLLFSQRLRPLWSRVGMPPGPWAFR